MPKPWSPSLEVHEWFFGLRAEWKRLLRTSPTPAHATRTLINAHSPDFKGDYTRRAIFYLMLAHYQCLDGCLQPRVRRNALAIIDRGADKVYWLMATPARRQRDFDRLREQILAATPT